MLLFGKKNTIDEVLISTHVIENKATSWLNVMDLSFTQWLTVYIHCNMNRHTMVYLPDNRVNAYMLIFPMWLLNEIWLDVIDVGQLFALINLLG